MLQLRTALFVEADKFDAEAFAWTGRAKTSKVEVKQDRVSDHVVNVLAAQIGRTRHFDVAAMMATYDEWTKPPVDIATEIAVKVAAKITEA